MELLVVLLWLIVVVSFAVYLGAPTKGVETRSVALLLAVGIMVLLFAAAVLFG